MAACDEPEAREALDWAAYAGETRDTSLVAVELALRTGDESERVAAKARIARLLDHDESTRDPWVAAIARDLETRCP
jgi:hypothetical protein